MEQSAIIPAVPQVVAPAAPGLNWDTICEFKKSFQESKHCRLAQDVCTTVDPLQVCLDRTTVRDTNHVFEHTVPPEAKPITNQLASGRCWIFSCLNMMRLPFMEKKNIDKFEFSQSYLFFWDKVERCNYMLKAYVETAQRDEPVDGRLVQFLLSNPTNDGGQWDMLVNLIEKYGVVPKQCFPESYNSESSKQMNDILSHMLRENCLKLRKMVESNEDDDTLNEEINTMMGAVYRVVSMCLGTPPETISFEYREKVVDTYRRIGPLTPYEFYRDEVKPLVDVSEKICLVNDPRPQNPYKKLYSVEFLGNMVKGRTTLYNNQPIEVMKDAAAESIKNGQAVWFGCDVGKQSLGKLGINDMNVYDQELLFDVPWKSMNKAERLIYGDSLMTHAMILSGFTEKDGKEKEYKKWRVENSWGKAAGSQGYLAMSDDWFSEYVFEVVVDKKYVSDDVLAVMRQSAKILDAWDPMGALA
ncbi:hypothetical protein COCON_G00078150 [Conger conger]|uniref:Bleomycin hydrolase n=1 Tax=Conger conger TaxID=82655 RepID=A0A9Q1DP35_CONCO|nr:bleomycin hydrolase-like [Conger conger]KAJ8276063.1 hypothetical protein COCON_G00078150 [Conger conger]